jgi:hypothetical protein
MAGIFLLFTVSGLDEMHGAYTMHYIGEKCTDRFNLKPRSEEILGYLRITLKVIIKK